jgi:hypothetical protein
MGLKTVHIQESLKALADFMVLIYWVSCTRILRGLQVNALMYMTECDRRVVEYIKKGYIVIRNFLLQHNHIFNEQIKKFMTPAEIQIFNYMSKLYVDPCKTAVHEGVIKDILYFVLAD